MDWKTTILAGLGIAAAGVGFVVGAPVAIVGGVVITGYTAVKYFTNKTQQEIQKTQQEQEETKQITVQSQAQTQQIQTVQGLGEAAVAGITPGKLDDINVMLKKFFPYILIGMAVFLVVMFFRGSK